MFFGKYYAPRGSRCMDRFMDSWNLVSQTLQKRLQDDLAAGSAAGGSFSWNLYDYFMQNSV